MLLSKFAVCNIKKFKFIKEPKASGLLSSLRIKTSLDKIFSWSYVVLKVQNESNNKQVFISRRQIHAWKAPKPGFAFFVCGSFIKTKKRILEFSDTGGSRFIYQSELDKACFQCDMAYGDFKYLPRTASDKVLHNKAFNITKNSNMMNINVDLIQWFMF